MSMGVASSPSSLHTSKFAKSPLDAPWDVSSLAQPGHSSSTPPVSGNRYPGTSQQVNGAAYAATNGRRDSATAQILSNSPSRNGSVGGHGGGSANASPNPNRYSAGYGKAATAMNGMTAGLLANYAAGNGQASAPPPRPSRAGTLPLDSLSPLVTNGLSPTNGSVNGTSTMASPSMASPPSFMRAPASMSNIHQPLPAHQYQSMTMGDQSHMMSPNGGNSPSVLSPPPLIHQPFSAPGNPYAGANGSETTVVAQLHVRNSGGSDEKDLPEKPKGRERSLTNKSNKDGKKSVFGFMSGKYLYSSVRPINWLNSQTSDLLSKDKSPVISGPYDPVHLTHVGFNSDTGECKSFCDASFRDN
jgi:hypothetical protein